MKASEISIGQRVAIREGGRSTHIIGFGVVTQTGVPSSSYGSRVDSTVVRRIEEDGSPVYKLRWDTEQHQMVKTDELHHQTVRNAQLISDEEYRDRQKKAQDEAEERHRIYNLRSGVIEGVKASMAKLGISEDDVTVIVTYHPAEGDEGEGVQVERITVHGDSCIALQNLVNKELELIEQNGGS